MGYYEDNQAEFNKLPDSLKKRVSRAIYCLEQENYHRTKAAEYRIEYMQLAYPKELHPDDEYSNLVLHWVMRLPRNTSN